MCRAQNYSIPLQGSGTFGVESVLGSALPKTGSKLLVVINGNYGMRMAKIASVLDINAVKLIYDENVIPSADDVAQALDNDPQITHVGIVHSETVIEIN